MTFWVTLIIGGLLLLLLFACVDLLQWRARWKELGRIHARLFDDLANAQARIEVLQSQLDTPDYWFANQLSKDHDPGGHRPSATVLRLRPETAAGLVPPGWARPQDWVPQERQPLPGVQAPVGQCPPGPAPGSGGGEDGPFVAPASMVTSAWIVPPVSPADDLGGVPRGSLDPHR